MFHLKKNISRAFWAEPQTVSLKKYYIFFVFIFVGIVMSWILLPALFTNIALHIINLNKHLEVKIYTYTHIANDSEPFLVDLKFVPNPPLNTAIEFEGKKIATPAELAEILSKKTNEMYEYPAIKLIADDRIPWQSVVDIISACRKAGLSNVTFSE